MMCPKQITPQFQQRIQPTPEEPSVEVVDQQVAPTNQASVDVQRDDHVQRDELTSIQAPEENNQVPPKRDRNTSVTPRSSSSG